MKKIIVPIDFSPASRDAYLFARALAKVFNASLKVIHIYSGSFSTHESLIIREGLGRQEIIREKLAEFVGSTLQEKEEILVAPLHVETEAIHGFTVAQIVKEAQKSEAMMIIMGTTGKHDVLEKTIGSISTAVAQQAHCPVLLVPKSFKYQGLTNILYATNFESAKEGTLRKITDLANIFRATMHFIHVNSGQENDPEELEDRIFEFLFKDGDPSFALNLATIPSESVVKGLNQYAAENNIDLVVLVSQRRNFLDNIFGKSLTKKMLLYTKIPVLVFPPTSAAT